MSILTHKGKDYQLDQHGFLSDFDQWDEDFAEGMAPVLKMEDGITETQWQVIESIRAAFLERGKCPLLYQICRKNQLRLRSLKKLFPAGYWRGACKLAGISYKHCYVGLGWSGESIVGGVAKEVEPEKTYVIDAYGFLVSPSSWDEQFALIKAEEMKIPGRLTEKHWQIIRYLRESYQANREIPTVYETCESNNLEIEDLERLFPDGYRRGAVKIAGLRMKTT